MNRIIRVGRNFLIVIVPVVVMVALLGHQPPREEYHLSGDKWIFAKRGGTSTEIYTLQKDPKGPGPGFRVEFVGLDPILTIPGKPKIVVDSATTITLQWECGEMETHDLDSLRPGLKIDPKLFDIDVDEIIEQLHAKKHLDETGHLRWIEPPRSSAITHFLSPLTSTLPREL